MQLKVSLEQIVKGCIMHDRNSQSQLYKIFAPKMLGVCMRYCPNREEAEELLQEGFFRIFKYINTLKNVNNPGGWIHKIIVNTALQRYTPKSYLYPVLNIEDSTAEVVDSYDIFSNYTVRDIISMVQNLPTSYRLVFNLYVFEGYKHGEIAELLNISEGTSKSNLFMARSILKKNLTRVLKVDSFS